MLGMKRRRGRRSIQSAGPSKRLRAHGCFSGVERVVGHRGGVEGVVSTSTWVPLQSLSGARGDPSEERIAVSMCLLRPLITKSSRCSVSRCGVACRWQPTSQCGRARRFVLHTFHRVISGIIAKPHANGVKRTVLMKGWVTEQSTDVPCGNLGDC